MNCSFSSFIFPGTQTKNSIAFLFHWLILSILFLSYLVDWLLAMLFILFLEEKTVVDSFLLWWGRPLNVLAIVNVWSLVWGLVCYNTSSSRVYYPWYYLQPLIKKKVRKAWFRLVSSPYRTYISLLLALSFGFLFHSILFELYWSSFSQCPVK